MTGAGVELSVTLEDIRAGLDAVQRDIEALIGGANAVLGLLPAPSC